MGKPRVLLVGAGGDRDRPDHFGCQFVSDILRKAFSPVRCIPVTQRNVKRDVRGIDFVVVNAEGSTHDNKCRHLYGDWERPAVFINGVWQDNGRADLSHFLYVSVRECLSAWAMRDCGVTPAIVPDVMLSVDFGIERGGGMIVSDSVIDRGTGLPLTRANLPTFLRADRLVCGRFHAACLAIATGKPFSCYPSNTHKTAGMMADAGLRNFYTSSHAAIEACPTEPDPKAAAYLQDARLRIAGMLDFVRDLISQA